MAIVGVKIRLPVQDHKSANFQVLTLPQSLEPAHHISLPKRLLYLGFGRFMSHLKTTKTGGVPSFGSGFFGHRRSKEIQSKYVAKLQSKTS